MSPGLIYTTVAELELLSYTIVRYNKVVVVKPLRVGVIC